MEFANKGCYNLHLHTLLFHIDLFNWHHVCMFGGYLWNQMVNLHQKLSLSHLHISQMSNRWSLFQKAHVKLDLSRKLLAISTLMSFSSMLLLKQMLLSKNCSYSCNGLTSQGLWPGCFITRFFWILSLFSFLPPFECLERTLAGSLCNSLHHA